MPAQKLYAGAKLREVRTRIGLTQKDFAAKLGVSLPYLNQMENNNRPVSTGVVLGLAQEFGLDVTELGSGDTERLVSDMRRGHRRPRLRRQCAAALRPAPRRLERTGAGPRLPRPAPRLSPDP
jgi:transcriptional regulator with XRE-family HTH domain